MSDQNQGPLMYSKEVEETVLSGLLIAPNDIFENPLEADDFYIHKHRFVFEAFMEIINEKNIPDYASLVDRLERNGKLDEIGGPAYITSLLAGFSSYAGLEQHVKTLRDYRARRILRDQAQWIFNKAIDFEFPVDKIQDRIIVVMSNVQTAGRKSRHIREVVSDVFDDVEEASKRPNEIWGIKTGFLDFDRVTGGLQPGETVFITAPPGIGKSIFANQAGYQIAEHDPVWLVSLEMKDIRVARRLLSAESEVFTRNLNTGLISPEEWDRFIASCEKVSNRNIHIWDQRGLTLAQFRAEASRLKRLYGIKVIVLDYLFLMGGYDDVDMIPRTEALSKGILNIAEQLDVAIIVINSVTKEGIMRGSGQLLHDADIIIKIQQAAMTLNSIEINPDLRLRKLIFEKFRDGDMGDGYEIVMGLTRGYPKFVDLTAQDEKLNKNLDNLTPPNQKQSRLGV